MEIMKIMATSFKRSHARTATLSAPNPAASHCQPTPLLETPGSSWTSLGQSLMGSLLLSPGSSSGTHKLLFVPSKSLFPQSCASSSSSIVGSIATSAAADLFLHTQTLRGRSGSVSVGSLGPGVHKVCLSPLSVAGRYGV